MQKIYTAIASLALLAICFSCEKNAPRSQSKLDEKAAPYDLFAFERSYPDRDFDWKGWRNALTDVRGREIAQARSTGCAGNITDWTLEGPTNVPGRVNTLAVKPDDENTLLAGFAGGGIFKSTDGGVHWHPVFDDHLELAIGDISFDPNDPNVVYAGTGDPNMPAIVFNGNGVYKSTDAGETWHYLGLAEQGIVSKIVVSHTNPQTLFVSTMGNPYVRDNQRGVYKSTDGGATWQQSLFVSDQAGASDLVMSPADPQVLYASFWDRIRNNHESVLYGPHARVYKTTDGGATWQQLGGGLPTINLGRTGLAISEQNPDKLFVVYIDSLSRPYGIYRTTNGGQTWISVNAVALEDVCADFGWYFGKIKLNPLNDEQLYFHAIIMWRKVNNNGSWEIASGGHADSHDLAFCPSGRRYWANDGGVYRNDPGQGPWTKSKNLPTTQFYHVCYNPHTPDVYWAGSQDNGIVKGGAAAPGAWGSVASGDGFRSVFHPTNPQKYWIETQNGRVIYSPDGGGTWLGGGVAFGSTDRTNWDSPFFLSAHDTSRLYGGTYRIRTSQDGELWVPISGDLTDGVIFGERFHNISALNESPVQAGKLLAGTSDGNVWTRSPTNTWTNITAGLPERYVTSVQGSLLSQNRIFVTHSGFRDNDNTPHIHRSDDNGATWVNISGNLPPLPVNDLFVMPGQNDAVLFAATDVGVYFTLNGGGTWARLGGAMPYVPVFDLAHNIARNRLAAATYARGAWSFPLDSIFVQQATVNINLAGAVRREGGEGVSNVEINEQIIASNGLFNFNELPGCQPYTLAPYRNDNPLNGVTTFDLVLISKHLLGTDTIDSPYKIIAADANRSGSVTSFDIVTLRRLILGIDTVFANNTSWRFVPASFQFPDPFNPFVGEFPEEIAVPAGMVSLADLDFVGLKVGDVNDSNVPSLNAETRLAAEWPIDLQDVDFQANEKVEAIFSAEWGAVVATQFSLRFDAASLDFQKIEPLAPGLSAANFGSNRAREGFLTASFERPESAPNARESGASSTESLFKIVFWAKKSGRLNAAVSLESWPTAAASFERDGRILRPVLRFSGERRTLEWAVKIWPNPMGRAGAWVDFQAQRSEGATLQVFDLQGVVVFSEKIPAHGGLRIPGEVFPRAGVYFYRIEGAAGSAVGKLVFAAK